MRLRALGLCGAALLLVSDRASAAAFDCLLAVERVQQLAKNVDKNAVEYAEMREKLEGLSRKFRNPAENAALERLRIDLAYLTKMTPTQTAEIAKELERARRAACAQLPELQDMASAAQAAAQKIAAAPPPS